MTQHRFRGVRLLGLALLTMIASAVVALAGAAPAAATHYRANQLTWVAGSGAGVVEFRLTGSWRCTAFSNPCTLAPGDPMGGSEFINTGDGGSVSAPMTVVSVDVANDVVNAESRATHTYAAPGAYVASASSCCRLSSSDGHMNNGDGNVRYETLVDLAATSASPVGLVPPIVDCPISALCTFSVPATDPDGQPMAWRLSSAVEAGGSFVQPTGASINANSGQYTWDTTGAALATVGSTFYSTQVMIENVIGGQVKSRTAVDFFIRLGSNSSNNQPTFTTPTPANGDVINATVGSPVSFGVAATDPETVDTVTLSVLGSPAGASFTPTSGNPATGTFSWTPSATGDYSVTLLASDNHGLGAVPRTVTLHVTNGGNPPPFVDAGPTVSGNVGVAVSLDGTVTDTEPVTTAWTAIPGAGVSPSSTCTFGNAAAVDTTVTCSDDGTWTLKLTANDGTNPAVSDTTTMTLTNPPPTVDAGANRTGNEGSAISLDGTITDTESVASQWTATAGAGVDPGATCAFANAAAVDTTVTCTDDGTWTVRLSGNDGTNAAVTDTATVTVANVKPTVDITTPTGAETYETGTPVQVSATVGDAGSNDTLTCSIDWGDGTVAPGTRSGSTCTGSHAYAVDGGRTITVTVTDDDGGSAFDTVGVLIDTEVVAPEKQKVTGGGFIKPDGDRVSFAFVARTHGTGFAGQLVTKDGKDKFKGTTVSALTVTGKKATWSGTGKWKGKAKHTFTVTVQDNRQGNKGGPDTFEIVVKNASGAKVFSASGPVKGGKITIH